MGSLNLVGFDPTPSPSRKKSLQFQNGVSFYPFLLISWDPTRWGDVLMEGVGYGWNFHNGESFSPFLLISWDSVRFVQTPPPPREVLSISWDLKTKIINGHNFCSAF